MLVATHKRRAIQKTRDSVLSRLQMTNLLFKVDDWTVDETTKKVSASRSSIFMKRTLFAEYRSVRHLSSPMTNYGHRAWETLRRWSAARKKFSGPAQLRRDRCWATLSESAGRFVRASRITSRAGASNRKRLFLDNFVRQALTRSRLIMFDADAANDMRCPTRQPCQLNAPPSHSDHLKTSYVFRQRQLSAAARNDDRVSNNFFAYSWSIFGVSCKSQTTSARFLPQLSL